MNKLILNVIKDGLGEFVFNKYPDLHTIVSKETFTKDIEEWFYGGNDSSSSSKRTTYDENALNKMTLVELRAIAVSMGIKKTGLKANVIKNILTRNNKNDDVKRNCASAFENYFKRDTFNLVRENGGDLLYDHDNKLVFNMDRTVVGYYKEFDNKRNDVVLPLTSEKIEFCRSKCLEYVVPVNITSEI